MGLFAKRLGWFVERGKRSHPGQEKSRHMPFPPKTLLRVERLEERTLLSVSAAEYAEIRAAYADFGLSENMADVNIIEIESANLALAHLKAAITTAGDDLIVVRTTDSANTITYTDTSDEITIHINSTTYGKLNIVGFGTKSLTLNAAQKSRVINITAGTVHLGNLTVTGGVCQSWRRDLQLWPTQYFAKFDHWQF